MSDSTALAITSRGSRFLSLDGWTYDAIAGLHRRGLLPGLDPLSQPYTRMEVASAIRRLDPARLDGPAAHWTRLLRAELAAELTSPSATSGAAYGFQLAGGGVASTTRRQQPLLPLRGENGTLASRAWPNYAVGGWAELGRFAIETRLYHDLYNEKGGDGDPDGRDAGGLTVFNRVDNAYLKTSFEYGSLFVGRTRRNWAPLGTSGLMMSPNPVTYPQIGLQLGTRKLAFRFLTGELDPLPGTLAGNGRYLAGQQLSYRTPDFAFAVGEAKVYTSKSGLLLANVNPLELFFFNVDVEANEPTSNTVLNSQLWMRRGAATFSAEALLDDISVSGEGLPGGKAPLRAALSLAATYLTSHPWLELGADYRVVTSLAYWSPRYVDQWTYFSRGLGENFSDFDRLTLRASVYPGISGLRLQPTVQLQRKGQGDIRQPVFANDSLFRSTPTLFIGVREDVTRIALAGRYQPVRMAFAEWDAGINRVSNADHVPGRSLTEFQGLLRVGLVLEIGPWSLQ